MLERLYMSLSAQELEKLFMKTVDRDILQALQYELNHRKTKLAKKLLIKVNEKLGVTPEAIDDSSSWKYEYVQLEKRHELLRATFNVEGELLARWGMTSAIPKDFEGIIFDAWSKALTAVNDEFGRTIDQLNSDLERLKVERRGMNPNAIVNFNLGKSSDE